MLAGRRVAGKCRRLSRSNRRHAHCIRAMAVGTLHRQGSAGANRVAFSGRIGTRPLAAGTYRLTARAADADGNAAIPRQTTFHVVRRARAASSSGPRR
jgi:hypothetical protein